MLRLLGHHASDKKLYQKQSTTDKLICIPIMKQVKFEQGAWDTN